MDPVKYVNFTALHYNVLFVLCESISKIKLGHFHYFNNYVTHSSYYCFTVIRLYYLNSS